MAKSGATTVQAYLAELPPERRTVVEEALALVRGAMPAGYEERIGYGMINWEVPLSRFPATYNGQPLCYVALAAQKHHYALYLTCAYSDPAQDAALRAAYAAAGRKLDMGKSCLRFKRSDDLVPDAVARVIASTPPDAFIRLYERSRA